MNSIRSIQALNKRELENVVPHSASWHADYRSTAYIYIGGLPFTLTEGDLITIFSQYGEPVFVKLVRDKETGKSKGFAFLKYEDQRSCDLAVDNLGGTTVLGRMLRVDHTKYEKRDDDEEGEGEVGYQAMGKGEREEGDGGRSSEENASSDEEKKEPRDAIQQEHDEEDPMKDYIAQEKKERSNHRKGGRERHRHGHHDGNRDRHRDDQRHHKHHRRDHSRSRSPRR